MSLADKANQYVDSKEPWVLIKQEGNEQAVQSICTTAINLFRILTIMLHPIIPGFTNQATDFLNEKDISWGSINKALLGTSINTFKPIIMRIEEEQIKYCLKCIDSTSNNSCKCVENIPTTLFLKK